jgi:nitrous oxidase accessory protein
MFSHQNRFQGNRFSDNAAGAVLMNSNGLVVRENVFAWNRGSRSYGLVLQTTTGATVERNAIVGNGIGIFLDNAIQARLTGNLVAGNWLALQLFPNSEATEITGNRIEGNTFDAAGGWSEGAYQLCREGRGNYWSAAVRAGYDLEGDGVLDGPFAASSPLGELAREREQLRLFLHSPAAGVIEWAERTFPVFSVSQAVDPCPLARLAVNVPDPARPAGRGRASAPMLVGNGAAGLLLLLATARLAAGARRKVRP